MPGIDIGIDTSEFKPDLEQFFFKNMLYYGEGKLTDTYYLKNVHLYKNGEFVNTGKHVIYVLAPEVKVGDYLTTCPVKGVAMRTDNEVCAFAKVIKGSVRPFDRNSDMVLKAYVEFL